MMERDAEPMHAVVATHGHCFDGLCSTVVFTRLIKHLMAGRSLRFSYHSASYGPGQNGVDAKLLTGAINAILDFRFTAAAELTWYFDHHVTAFTGPAERQAYEAHVAAHRGADRRMFHDSAYGSCTKLIADIGAQHFGLDPAPTAELVRWADLIDAARFPNATMAVVRREPELQLMTVVEHLGDDAFLARWVPRLLEEPLARVARAPEIVAAYAPLKHAHEDFVARVKSHAVEQSGVVFVDLSDTALEVASKFVTYALYPESAYSVLLSRSKSKCKISIGYNPWSPTPRVHDIAAICERHGGGGHPVVGAIALPVDQVGRAQALARAIATELAAPA